MKRNCKNTKRCILPINLQDCMHKVAYNRDKENYKKVLEEVRNESLGLVDTRYNPYHKKASQVVNGIKGPIDTKTILDISNKEYNVCKWHAKILYFSMIIQSKNMEQLNDAYLNITSKDFEISIEFWLQTMNCNPIWIKSIIKEVMIENEDDAKMLYKNWNNELVIHYVFNNNNYNKKTKIYVYKYGERSKSRSDYTFDDYTYNMTEMYLLRKEYMFHGIKKIKEKCSYLSTEGYNKLIKHLCGYKMRHKDEFEYGDKDINWDNWNDVWETIENKEPNNISDESETSNQSEHIQNAPEIAQTTLPYKPTTNYKVCSEALQDMPMKDYKKIAKDIEKCNEWLAGCIGEENEDQII